MSSTLDQLVSTLIPKEPRPQQKCAKSKQAPIHFCCVIRTPRNATPVTKQPLLRQTNKKKIETNRDDTCTPVPAKQLHHSMKKQLFEKQATASSSRARQSTASLPNLPETLCHRGLWDLPARVRRSRPRPCGTSAERCPQPPAGSLARPPWCALGHVVRTYWSCTATGFRGRLNGES